MNIYTLTGEVLLKGTNEAIDELRRLEEQAEATAEKLGKLVTNINANFKASTTHTIDSLSKVNKSAKSFESDFSKTMNRIGKTLLTVFSAREIIGFAKDVTEASAEVTAEIVAFNQILGDYADSAKLKMEEMADSAGIVSTRLTKHMTNLTAKFKGLGFEMNEATDLAVRGLEMATDASAFWDMSLEQSMEHMKSFINGNYEGGEAIGLFANETQMAYYAIEKGLIASRKAWIHLDEATKQATRLEFAERMFDQAQITGHAARESEHFANVLANLKESFRQLKASIGDSYLEDALIPAMDSLRGILDDINENVEKFNAWLENNEVIKHFSELWTKVAIEAGISLAQIEYQFKKFWDWLVNESFLSPILKPIVDWTSDSMQAFKKGLETGNWEEAIEEMKNAIPPSLKPTIEWGSESVKEFIEALETGDWSGIFEGILRGVSVALTLTYAKNGLERALNSITHFAISNGWLTKIGTTGLLAMSIGVKVQEAMEDSEWNTFGIDFVAALIAGLLVGGLTASPVAGKLVATLVLNLETGSKVVDWIKRENEKIHGAIKEVEMTYNGKPITLEFNTNDLAQLEGEFKSIYSLMSQGMKNEFDAFDQIINRGSEQGKRIAEEICRGFGIGLDLETLSEEEAQLFLDILKAEFGIASPSKKAQEIGNFIVQGFEKGFNGLDKLGEDVGNELLKGMQESLEIHSPSEKTILLASFLLDGFELGLKSIEDLGSEAGQNLILGMYDLIKDDRAFEIGTLIGEAINEGLLSKLDAETLTAWVNHVLNNPPNIDEGGSGGTSVTGQATRQNRYNQLSASLEDREGELEAAMTNLYNARADFGFDSDEAKAIESEVAALEKWIAKLKELIDEIENPIEEDNTFFGKIKKFVDNTQDKIEESKDEYGQYIDFIEDKFSEASEYLSELTNGIFDIFVNSSETSVAQLEKSNKEELELLEEQLKNKEICHADYYKKKEELENNLLKEKDTLERRKFNAERVNALSEVWSNLASGTMRIWAEYATMPWLAGSLTAILGATAIAQTAAIAAQKYVPLLAQGGIVNSATHAIIGEDGKEAVVPLERNLEWVDGLARAITPAIDSNALAYTPEMSSVRTEIVELRRMLAEYLPQIVEKDTQLSIDGRVLSNAIAPMMDKSLGSISRLKARGV